MDIDGYEGLYQVSSLGRVRSLDRFVYSYRSKDGKALVRGKILKPCLNSNDKEKAYRFITFNDRKKYKVYRLVAFAFPEICGEYFEGAEVNHKNEIKTDDRAENLEWCTREYNINYGTRLKRMSDKMKGHTVSDETKRKIVEKRRENDSYKHSKDTIDRIKETRKRKPVLQYTIDGVFVKEYQSLLEASSVNCYSLSNISSCCKERRKQAYGYVWKFKEEA